LAVLFLLLTNAFVFSFSVRSVNAAGIVYIRADGSIDPPTTPIQRNSNVYTFTGSINSDTDGIVIERDNIVLDGAGFTIQGSENGISLTSMSNVAIQNTNIRYFPYGIWVSYSSNNSISGNNITNSEYGILLDYSSNYNSVNGNNMTAVDNYNTHCGIHLNNSCNYNSISGNNIANNDIGISLASSFNNSISGNSFDNNGLFVAEDSFGNVVSANLVNGKPLVYLEGVSDVVVGDAGQVVLVQCNRIRVENLNLSTATIGVELWQTNNTEISENNVTATTAWHLRARHLYNKL
jgi:parallel beta-helix repeat protein